jgi:hypothetical protein
MEKQTKILIGVGAVIAAYLILNPKKVVISTQDTTAQIPMKLIPTRVAPINGKCPSGYYKETIRCIVAPCPEGMCVLPALKS